MNWTPENQMDIFETLDTLPMESRKPKFMPEQRYLEAKHFDPEQTNPNFISYLKANGKNVGDPYRLNEAQKWIDVQVAAFKRANGRSEHDMLNEIEDWPSKLRIYLRNIAKPNG